MSAFTPTDHDHPGGGSHIRTANGIWVNLLAPVASTLRLGDIATALSHICRFGGHLPAPYSVGEHSMHVAAMLNRQYGDQALTLRGLMHDAAEAYLGDRSLPDYRAVEWAMLIAIGERFDLGRAWWDDERIHEADSELLAWEMATVRDCPFRVAPAPFAVAAAFQAMALRLGIKR